MDYDICDMKFINLNSSNAVSNNGTFNSDVNFLFKSIIHDDPGIDYVSIGILNAQIPVSFYTINYTNDTLIFNFASNTYNIVITRGNYNSNSLISELKSKFQLIGFDMDIQTSRITGIMTFISVNSIPFSFIGTSSIFPILGFTQNINYSSVGSQIVASYPLNLLGIKRLKVNSINLSTNTFDSVTLGINSNLASIPVNVPSFAMIDYVNNSNAYPILFNKNITFIDIQIVDENNNLINFNGIHWTITIQMNIYRKGTRNNSTSVFENISNILEDIKDELTPQETTENNDNSDNDDNTIDTTNDNTNPANYNPDVELELLLNN